MTSVRQFEANRRNSQKSTGPKTARGKWHSRRNAFRHGLCAETVIEILEDVEDYKAFEATITADYEPRTAVERELVLRLASLLWRIRRATAIDTDLFRMQAEVQRETSGLCAPPSRPAGQPANVIYGFGSTVARNHEDAATDEDADTKEMPLDRIDEQTDTPLFLAPSRPLARSFLGIAKLDGDAFTRLGRYEARLWRQFAQTVLALQSVQRRVGPKWVNRWVSE
jgi:hypothetical protein